MTEEERYKITSNDYMDIIVDYGGNPAILETFQNETNHIINNRFAVVYVPTAQITARSVGQYGFAAIPACYGLESMRSLEVSGVLRLREAPAFGLRGAGVLIGIVDTGIDYTNPVFLREDGSSKIISIWDQTIDSENQFPAGTYYGTEYRAEQINQALASGSPFNLVPSRDDNGHGTMLAGIAAGSVVEESNFSGVVPDSELVIVKLKQAKVPLRDFFAIPLDADCYQENDIIWGVQYLVEIARELQRPMAICIGLGSSQGSHDGRGILSSFLSVAGDFPGITVCVSAGNEGNLRRHYYASVDPAIGFNTVELNIGENESGFAMELWGAAPSTYSIDITSPGGEYIPRIPENLQLNREVSFIFENTRIQIDYLMVEASTGDQLIFMRFYSPAPGVWTFQVYARGDLPGSFHIWLPMGDFITQDTYFVQSNPYTTITSPGNALVPITVTAYNPESSTLYQNASKGYSRINEIKPEFAAPGVNILSPTLEQGFAPVTGTGAAAAHSAGITAMLLEWGIVRGNYPGIDTVEVKKLLIRGAKRNPRQQYPNRDWGYGIIDVYNVFNILRSDS